MWLQPVLAALSNSEIEAQSVLTRYFSALTQGDITTLKSLLGGDLLNKRIRLLNNPTYPAFLVETYGSAHFSIEQISTVNSTDIEIDASIIFDHENIARRRFLLHKDPLITTTDVTYQIYQESDQNNY
jgi:hypothetical protein